MIRNGKDAKPIVANAAKAKLNMQFSPFFLFCSGVNVAHRGYKEFCELFIIFMIKPSYIQYLLEILHTYP
jgi:hypothetical protein